VTVEVVEVVDGDTVHVRYGNGTRETVRLLGVDTPEVRGETSPDEFEGVPETDDGRQCLRTAGDRASDYARERLAGRTVGLGFDEAEGRRGYYDRLLGYVYVDGRQFNYDLVATGHARVYDSGFLERDRYEAAERAARASGRGVWTCATDRPTGGSAVADGGVAVEVVEVRADAPGDDNENLAEEYVVVQNVGESTVDLSGWTVADAAGHAYAVPEGTTLEPGATLTIRTGRGTDEPDAGVVYWGRDGAVWNNGGDTVTVRDATGATVTERSY
jgi:micrococcal nuclease